MDNRTYLIIIDGKDKTKSLDSCDPIDGQYRIQFQSSPDVYTYRAQRVEYYANPTKLSPNNYRIYKDGNALTRVNCILDFGKHLRISFEGNPTLYLYDKTQITISTSCLTNDGARECLQYFSCVADFVGLKTPQGKNLLKNQYDDLTFAGNETALARYLSPALSFNDISDTMPIIFPFGFNLSQKSAVEKAFTSQISLIEGPPGTGKTQTILNIIANALIRNKTVAVVSNNNSATQNVQDKLAKYGLSFFTAFLGNAENKDIFMKEQSDAYPHMDGWKIEDESLSQTTCRVGALSRELDSKLDAQNRIAIVRQELADIQLEYAYFEEYYNKKEIPRARNKEGFSVLQADHLLDLWLQCEAFAEKKRQPSFWFKLMSQLRYGRFDRAFYSRPMENIISEFQKQFYELRIKELEKEIDSLQKLLTDFHFENKLKEFTSHSMELLKAALYQKYRQKEKRKLFSEDCFWKDASSFIEEYPLILSTTQSLRRSLTGIIYDYVIVDEASQVDVVTGALALSCARNLVVVGDLKQLPNVVPDKVAKETQAIFSNFNLPETYEYSANSLLSSISSLLPHAPRTLLREHYRCHPKIIEFCNQKFYQGQLIIMTRDHGEPDVLKAHRSVEGNHARGRYNQRQIDMILDEVIPDFGDAVLGENIGIISPYRAQTDAATEQVDGTGIEVQTVHKYQGREKENIIVTTVDNQISEFVDNPNMLNVAVSRAEKRLRVVVSGNEGNENTNIGDLVKYMKYHNFEVVDSKIYSIFDLLYKQYAQRKKFYLANKKRMSEYHSEDLMEAVIRRVLDREDFTKLDIAYFYPLRLLIKDSAGLSVPEITYATNPMTHVDFVLFNRMDKKPVLVVETDGYDFHKKGTVQYERDLMKDGILEKMGIPIMRFKTNQSSEEYLLVKMLGQVLGKVAVNV